MLSPTSLFVELDSCCSLSLSCCCFCSAAESQWSNKISQIHFAPLLKILPEWLKVSVRTMRDVAQRGSMCGVFTSRELIFHLLGNALVTISNLYGNILVRIKMQERWVGLVHADVSLAGFQVAFLQLHSSECIYYTIISFGMNKVLSYLIIKHHESGRSPWLWDLFWQRGFKLKYLSRCCCISLLSLKLIHHILCSGNDSIVRLLL